MVLQTIRNALSWKIDLNMKERGTCKHCFRENKTYYGLIIILSAH